MTQPAVQVRCAIYVRKSSDDNLDLPFNSLEAQREFCEKYASDRKSQGWVVLPEKYEDGGVTGGTLDRPGLKKLIADVKARKIDCILTYKIDRLSRSQLGFLQLTEFFAENKVGYVSVTQPFETTTATGRAMMGSLMVFAQLEREMASERIRDKIAASRARGMWMGGVIPFGYDVVDRKLMINPVQAEIVRSIYERFLTLGSATKLAQELLQKNVTTRRGKPIDKGYLYKLLNNEVYVGRAVHKGTSYKGQHEPIISQELWSKVQDILQVSPRQRAAQTRSQTPALLKGLIFAPEGAAMSPSHTKRGKRTYRYYVSQTILKRGAGTCIIPRVPAEEVEKKVIDQLRAIFRSPEIIVQAWRNGHAQAAELREADVRDALVQLDPLWKQLLAHERTRIIQLLVARVDVTPNELRIQIRIDGLSSIAGEFKPSDEDVNTVPDDAAPEDGETITVCVPISFRAHGGSKQIIAADGTDYVPDFRHDGALLKAIARAFRWRKMLEEGIHTTLAELAKAEKINPSYVSRVLRLTLLSPDLVKSILDGRQPASLTLAKAMRPFSVSWTTQKTIFAHVS